MVKPGKPKKSLIRLGRSRRTKGAKSKGYNRKLTMYNRNVSPIAPRFVTHMKYSRVIVQGHASGQPLPYYIFRLNSLPGIDSYAGAHLPLGYNEISKLYQNYRVVSASYHVSVISGEDVITAGIMPCNQLPPGIGSYTNMDFMLEKPRAKFWVQNVGGTIKHQKGHIYIPKLFGVRKSVYMNDDKYQSVITQDPNQLAYLVIQAGDVGGNNTAQFNFALNITIRQKVEFFNPFMLARSNELEGYSNPIEDEIPVGNEAPPVVITS